MFKASPVPERIKLRLRAPLAVSPRVWAFTSKAAPEATVTRVLLPSAVAEPSLSVPALTATPPEKVLLPLIVRTPRPALAKAMAPAASWIFGAKVKEVSLPRVNVEVVPAALLMTSPMALPVAAAFVSEKPLRSRKPAFTCNVPVLAPREPVVPVEAAPRIIRPSDRIAAPVKELAPVKVV